MSTPPTSTPRLLLETSEALAYLNREPRAIAVERLLDLADAGLIGLSMARAGWEEIREAAEPERQRRLARLRSTVGEVGNVLRWGTGIWDPDVWGSDQSQEIDQAMPGGASLEDRDQLLVHEAGGYDFLVTADKHFTKRLVAERITIPLGLRVGGSAEALLFLQTRGVPAEEAAGGRDAPK